MNFGLLTWKEVKEITEARFEKIVKESNKLDTLLVDWKEDLNDADIFHMMLLSSTDYMEDVLQKYKVSPKELKQINEEIKNSVDRTDLIQSILLEPNSKKLKELNIKLYKFILYAIYYNQINVDLLALGDYIEKDKK